MWEPNEQLLIRVPVQYKKQDGSLFVTPRRVAFQQQGVPRLDPSIYYDTIYSLQQTPESSPKILFKIKTNPPESKAYTFQFTSHRALVEREGVKAQVSELYAKARGTSTSSLGTPAPFTPSGIASPSAPSTPVSHQPSPSSSSTTSVTPAATPAATPQQPPPPLPQQQGLGKAPGNGNGAAANKPSPPMVVNPQQRQEFGMRQQLLSSNDTLKKLHRELVIVTKAVSEEEFWASSYIKRIRLKHNMDPAAKEGKQKGRSSRMVELNPGQQEGADVKYTLTSQMIHSIFSEYPSVKRAYDNNVPDRLTEQNFWKRFLASEFFHRSRTGTRSQMTAYDDIFDRCLEEENAEDARGPDLSLLENIKQTINLEASQGDHDLEGGNAPDFTMVPGRTQQILPLIRRFNRHSSRVLDTQPKSNKVKPTTPDTDVPSYEDEILLSDLTNDQPPEKTILDIQDTSLYFESQSKTGSIKQLDEKEAERIIAGFKRQFEGWQSDLTKPIMTVDDANDVCNELTDRIRKKSRRRANKGSDIKLEQDEEQGVQTYHTETNEVLRHFWATLNPYRADKNTRVVQILRRKQGELNDVLANASDPERAKELLQPLIKAVNKAFDAVPAGAAAKQRKQ